MKEDRLLILDRNSGIKLCTAPVSLYLCPGQFDQVPASSLYFSQSNTMRMHFNAILLILAATLASTTAELIGRRVEADHTLALAPEHTLEARELISSRHDFPPTQTQAPANTLEERHLISSRHGFPPRNTLEAQHTLEARHTLGALENRDDSDTCGRRCPGKGGCFGKCSICDVEEMTCVSGGD